MNDRRDASWRGLVDTLEGEERILARLLRLAHRQHRYLMRGDLRRVNLCLRETEMALADARETTTRRREGMRLLGFEGSTGASALKSVARAADAPWRERVECAVEALARATERLGRKNVQNYQLARFSLDLVGEEMRLLLGATEGSGAAYGAEGEGHRVSLSGAVDGRA